MSREPLIQLRNVTRVFRGATDVTALRAVDLDVPKGEYLAVMGPSGAGKSTLLNILGLLDRPTTGSYRLSGRDTGVLASKDRARLRGAAVGFVFQAFHLLPRRTVWENVSLGMAYSNVDRSSRPERVDVALESVGLTHRARFRPLSLSGGERQRTALARAIVGQPELLLADEPTGNLDRETSGDVLKVVDGLNRSGLTVVVITHDVDVAARASRTLLLNDGRLEEPT
jgi:putative ABC transport system ATP-binding protein